MVDAVRLLKRGWWRLIVAVHKGGVIRRIMERHWGWIVRCLRMGEHALRTITTSREITTGYHSSNLRGREIPWAV
jgi:hypothetical protein